MDPAFEAGLADAARLTVAFLTLYSTTFVNALVTKKKLVKTCGALNEPFDRYNSPRMQTADRLNANFLEWSPIFLGLVWSLAAVGQLHQSLSTTAAWVYVGLRGLYIILILKHGVAANGLNKGLWVSTMPGYICLLYLWIQALTVLFMK